MTGEVVYLDNFADDRSLLIKYLSFNNFCHLTDETLEKVQDKFLRNNKIKSRKKTQAELQWVGTFVTLIQTTKFLGIYINQNLHCTNNI